MDSEYGSKYGLSSLMYNQSFGFSSLFLLNVDFVLTDPIANRF